MQDLSSLIFYFIIIIPSAIIHEYAHGWMALQLGDSTAKYAGRLTLNPLAHIDKWGTIFLPLLLYFFSGGRFMFAYAKPVPFNPYNLKYQKWGPALVGLAGPLGNLAVAVVFGFLTRLFIFTDSPLFAAVAAFFSLIIYANILLAVFNLMPIPPLDGSKILYALLPESAYQVREFLEKYGLFILIFFIFSLFDLVQPLIERLFRLIAGV